MNRTGWTRFLSIAIFVAITHVAGGQTPPPIPGLCSNITGNGQAFVFPEQPTACEEVDIFYFLSCFNLTNVTAITAEVRSVEGAFSTNLAMDLDADGFWVAEFLPPAGLTNYSLTVRDNNGVVDGDGTNRWRFSVSECPTFQFSPALPNVYRHDLTITYNPAEGPLDASTTINARVTFLDAGLTTDAPMTQFGPIGLWQVTVDLPLDTTNANVRFIDPTTLAADENDGPGWDIAISTNFGAARGDLDGDGFGDLIFRHPGERAHAVVLMRDGAIDFVDYLGGEPIDFTGLDIVAVSDLDGDSREDIIARVGPGIFAAALMDGPLLVDTLQLFEGFAAISPWEIVAGGDYNIDGWGDVVLQHPQTGRALLAFLQNGQWVEGQWVLGGLPLNPFRVVAGGDFSGDGGADLLLQLENLPIYGVLLDPTSDEPEWTVIDGLPAGWFLEAVGDFNGNGLTDLVLRQPDTGLYRIATVENLTVTATELLFGVGRVGGWHVEAQR